MSTGAEGPGRYSDETVETLGLNESTNTFDFDARYTVEGYSGIAWYSVGYEMIRDEDYEWSGMEYENQEKVRCIMVGDDRVFTFEVDQLTKISDDDYCPECGQIGCKAYG